jgi:hypothetical protein
MVIADRPMPANLSVRGYSHLLGESGLSVFGAAASGSQGSTALSRNCSTARPS